MMRTRSAIAIVVGLLLAASSGAPAQPRPQHSQGMELDDAVVFFSATTEGLVALSARDTRGRVARAYFAPDSVGPWVDSAAIAIMRLVDAGLPIAFDSIGPVLTGHAVTAGATAVPPGQLRLERRQVSTERQVSVVLRDGSGTEIRLWMELQEFISFAKGLRAAVTRTQDLAAGRRQPDDQPDPISLVAVTRTSAAANAIAEIGEALLAFAVEKPAMPAGGCQPEYPDSLRKAQIEGRVLAQFIVDTNGRAEPRSFRALQSADRLFTDAVRRALSCMRYTPAEVQGRRVRQVVNQPFVFGLRP